MAPSGRIILADLAPDAARRRLSSVKTLAVLVYTSDPEEARTVAEEAPALDQFSVKDVRSFEGWSVDLLVRRPR